VLASRFKAARFSAALPIVAYGVIISQSLSRVFNQNTLQYLKKR
jgi:hypothetical protein